MPQKQESLSNIKIEPAEFNLLKSEPIDTYISMDDSLIFTNRNENIPEQNICNICFKVCDDSVDVVIHKRISHIEKPYICQICNAAFVISAHLIVHLDEHDGGKFLVKSVLPIDVVSLSIDNFTEFLNKLKLSIPSTLKTNRVSGENGCVTKSIHTFKSNALTKQLYKCMNCKYLSIFRDKCLKHQSICKNNPGNKTNNKMYRCHLCPKAFINQTSLNGHMKYHSIRGEIISIRKRFRWIKKNNRGLNTSNKKLISKKKNISKKFGNVTKAYKCKDCNRNFISQKKLNNHIRQHKKQMMCNICNRQYFLKKRFEKHMLQHKNSEQNDCQTPLNKSKLLKPINRKLISKTLGNKIKSHRQCEWCNVSITWSNLHRHIKNKHPETRSLKCSHCSITFKDITSLRLHYSTFHKK